MGAPSKIFIDSVELSLVTLLRTAMPAAYGTVDAPIAIDINTVGTKDFNEKGQLAIKPPSIRVQFASAEFNNLHDNQRLSYEAGYSFEVLCYEGSLRSKADERLQTLKLVDVVLNQLAGARLALSDGTSSMPMTLRAVSLVIPDDEGPVDQLFSISVLVNGIAQFDGPNARFGS